MLLRLLLLLLLLTYLQQTARCTILHCKQRYGGAVLSVAQTNVIFKDCYFFQNYAIEEG
jgi:hypothetical protein